MDRKLQSEIVELTKELIRIPSTHSRPEHIDRCAGWIETWLDQHDIAFESCRFGTTPSILVLPEKRRTPVLLMSHFDVVETSDTANFIPREENGRLFGRGAIDDKYAVALSLVLFREHLKSFTRAGRRREEMAFGLLFTGDEEVGGCNGAKMVADDIATDFFIALDGGNPNLIVTKEKGILALELTATGKGAHAARPWLGTSAFDLLVEDYMRIRGLFEDQSDDHWHRTAVLTRCQAGNGSANILPEKARATLDIRYTENDDPQWLLGAIKERISSAVTVNAVEPVFKSRPSPYLELLISHSGGAGVGFEHGASDARYLSQRNISGAIWGANGEMSQHTDHEHIVLASLFHLYERLDSFLSDLELQRDIV